MALMQDEGKLLLFPHLTTKPCFINIKENLLVISSPFCACPAIFVLRGAPEDFFYEIT